MLLSYSGVVTLLLLILVLLTSLRLTLFESFKISLTSMFRSHHLLAWIFFVLATVHFFAAIAVLRTAKLPLLDQLLIFLSDAPSLSGVFAYLIFCAVMFAAHAGRFKRRNWLFVHRLSLLGVMIVAVHLIYVWRFRLTEFDVMTIVRWVHLCGVIAIVKVLVLHILRPDLLNSSRNFSVVSVTHIGNDLLDLTVVLDAGPKQWLSGHFGYFRFRCRGACGVSRRWHPFTILDCLGPNALRIVIKSVGSDTQALQHIEIGTRGQVIGPYSGISRLSSCNTPQLWLAGGLGIIAFLGLANLLLKEKLTDLDIQLVYLHRPEAKPYFIGELSQIVKLFSKFNLRVLPLSKENEQEINSFRLLFPDIAQRTVAIAGPHAMVVFWKKSLHRLGVKNILVEDYYR